MYVACGYVYVCAPEGLWLCVCVCVCVCVCARACVRACVRVYVWCEYVYVSMTCYYKDCKKVLLRIVLSTHKSYP